MVVISKINIPSYWNISYSFNDSFLRLKTNICRLVQSLIQFIGDDFL